MKLPTSTLGLLQLSAAASVYALESRQVPFSEEANKELMAICVPGYNSEDQDRTTPCFRAPDIGYECTIGDSPDKPATPEKQQECICKSEMWEFFKGCSNCFRLHGGKEGADYKKDEFYDSASSSFCNAKPTPIQKFLEQYQDEASPTTAETTQSDVLGTQTAVSLYFTQTGTTGNIDSLKPTTTKAPSKPSGGSEASGGSGTTGGSQPTGGSQGSGGTQATGGDEPTGTESGTGAQSTETGAASSLQDGSLLAPVAGAMLVMGLLG